MNESVDHQPGGDADRHVDVEIPAPVPVVGDPAAHRRTHDRRDHQTDPPHRHRQRLLVRRKGLHQDRLRERLQRGAGDSLQETERHHLIERLRRAAHRGGHDEGDDADQEVVLASELACDPAGGRDHDARRHQVGRHDPGHFVDAGRETALHVRQRDVDDRAVEHLQDGAQDDGQRDQPFERPFYVRVWLLGRCYRCGFCHESGYRDVARRRNSVRGAAAAAVSGGGPDWKFRTNTNVADIMQKSRALREYQARGPDEISRR